MGFSRGPLKGDPVKSYRVPNIDSKKSKIPITLIIGENDAKNKTIAINYIDGIESKNIEISEGMKSIKNILKEPVFKL